MTVWQQRVEESPAMVAVRELRAAIEEGVAGSPDEQDHLDRQLRISELIEWTLTNADPLLIPAQTLADLAVHGRQAIDHLTNWRSGAGPEHLTTHATNQLDLMLIDLGAIPVAETAAEATTEVASLRRSVGQYRGQVDRELEALTATSHQTQEDANTQVQQAAAKVTELEAQVQALRDELTQLTTTNRDLANQQQNAFAEAQTTRQETFSRLLEEKREETSVTIDELRTQVASEVASLQEQSASDLAEVSAAKARVEEILGIVGEEALVGTYSKNASGEGTSANFWRWVAVATIAVTVGIGVWLVVSAHTAGTDWDLFAAKLVLAIPVGAVAAYAARQSSEHRHSQREAEHVALQLVTLKPYLNDLEKAADRDQLLIEIAGRLFGHPRRDRKPEGAALDSLVDNPTLLGQLVAVLQQLNKGT